LRKTSIPDSQYAGFSGKETDVLLMAHHQEKVFLGGGFFQRGNYARNLQPSPGA
jgi:hypothetical protein